MIELIILLTFKSDIWVLTDCTNTTASTATLREWKYIYISMARKFIFSLSSLNFPWLSFARTYSSQLCSWLVKFLGYKTEETWDSFYWVPSFLFYLLAERLRNALNRGMNQEFDRRTSRELNEAVPQTEILGIVSLNFN